MDAACAGLLGAWACALSLPVVTAKDPRRWLRCRARWSEGRSREKLALAAPDRVPSHAEEGDE